MKVRSVDMLYAQTQEKEKKDTILAQSLYSYLF